MQRIATFFFLALALGASALAQEVRVQDAWVRATVQGQKASGAFMTLTAAQDTRLVGARSPVAGAVGVHEMRMDGNVMHMQEVEGGLALPAGKPVQLKPGAYHIMLMDLKVPLQKDSAIALTLLLQDAKGQTHAQDIRVPVLLAAPMGMAMDMPMH